MSAKISKSMKVELITKFFMNKGQRMTNLGKADIKKLDSIITKYNIDIEYEAQKLRQLKDQQKIEKEARDKKYEEENEQLRLALEAEAAALNKAVMILWTSISGLQQRWVCERLKDTINKKRQKDNEFAIRTTDVMEADFKKNGARIVRESPNELRVNGILVCNNYIEKMMTTDEVIQIIPDQLRWHLDAIKDIKVLLEHNELKGKNIQFVMNEPDDEGSTTSEDVDCICAGCHNEIKEDGFCSEGCRYGEIAGFWTCKNCSNKCENVEVCPNCKKSDDESEDEDEKIGTCDDCAGYFDAGKDTCKTCDFDLNSYNKPDE